MIRQYIDGARGWTLGDNMLGLAAFGEGIGAEADVSVFGRKWRSAHNPVYSLQTSEAFSKCHRIS